MYTYSRILIAVDLHDSSRAIAERGLAIARGGGAEVWLLHVVENIPVDPMGDNPLPPAQLIEELLNDTRQQLVDLAAALGISASRCDVVIGSVKAEIIQGAQERGCDLIVLGAHERHGLSIFLNLTEDTVLHTAPCDVLAVRVGPRTSGGGKLSKTAAPASASSPAQTNKGNAA